MTLNYAAKDWIMRAPNLTWREKGVLTVISQYQGSKLCCWVKQETLVEATGLSDRHLREVLDSLRAKFYLVSDRVQPNQRQPFGQNHYAVCWPEEWDRVRMRFLNDEHRGVNCSRVPAQNGAIVQPPRNGAANPPQDGAITSSSMKGHPEETTTTAAAVVASPPEPKTQDQDQTRAEVLAYLGEYSGRWEFMLNMKALVEKGTPISDRQVAAVSRNMTSVTTGDRKHRLHESGHWQVCLDRESCQEGCPRYDEDTDEVYRSAVNEFYVDIDESSVVDL